MNKKKNYEDLDLILNLLNEETMMRKTSYAALSTRLKLEGLEVAKLKRSLNYLVSKNLIAESWGHDSGLFYSLTDRGIEILHEYPSYSSYLSYIETEKGKISLKEWIAAIGVILSIVISIIGLLNNGTQSNDMDLLRKQLEKQNNQIDSLINSFKKDSV